jgi:hypothetical protein
MKQKGKKEKTAVSSEQSKDTTEQHTDDAHAQCSRNLVLADPSTNRRGNSWGRSDLG